VQTTYILGEGPCGLYLLIATNHHCRGPWEKSNPSFPAIAAGPLAWATVESFPALSFIAPKQYGAKFIHAPYACFILVNAADPRPSGHASHPNYYLHEPTVHSSLFLFFLHLQIFSHLLDLNWNLAGPQGRDFSHSPLNGQLSIFSQPLFLRVTKCLPCSEMQLSDQCVCTILRLTLLALFLFLPMTSGWIYMIHGGLVHWQWSTYIE